MTADVRPPAKANYQTYDEFRKKFYTQPETAEPRREEETDKLPSFGRRLAQELASRK